MHGPVNVKLILCYIAYQCLTFKQPEKISAGYKRGGARNRKHVTRLNYFHTPTYALVSYITKSDLIIYIKTLYSLIASTCFDISRVIIRERFSPS
jgi:hypothetical protein